jgi:hypothetical protein
VRGQSEPSGGRARVVYELTEAGQLALHGWLASDDEPLYELRDEGMLKLFFSDAAPERRVENIRAMRARQERKLAQLRALEPYASGGAPGPYLTLQFGIDVTKSMIKWCEATERHLTTERRLAAEQW